MNESNFSEDLQNFTKLFLAVDQKKAVVDVMPMDTFSDKYGREHSIYFDYDIRTYQRPPPNLSKKNKFINMKAETIYTINFSTLFAGKNMWMIKPSGLSRGRGLELFTKLEELKKFLHMFTKEGYIVQDYSVLGYSDDQVHSPWVEFQESNDHNSDSIALFNSVRSSSVEAKMKKTPKGVGTGSTFTSFVIQKYIEKPLLYKGHKFDIRVFAVFTPKKELYVFR